MRQLTHFSNYLDCYRSLFLFAFFTCFIQSANADWKSSEFIVDNICYRVTNYQSTVAVTYDWCYINDGTGVKRYTGPYEGDVTIPDFVTYNSVTYKVTAIDAHALDGRSSVTSISLPNTIISIGEYAFLNCSGLISITLPQNITSIGSGAFSGCESLTSFSIPNSVTSIGQSAFSYTGWYNAQPDGILYLDNWLIDYKGDRPTGVITIKSGTKGLAENVFWYSTGLTSVIIPSSVTYIGKYAFDDCSGLTSVHISDIAAWCKISFGNSESNPLYYAHHLYLGEDEITDLEIPNSVTKIGEDAFYGCSGLTSVTIPNSVTTIGGRAFSGCSGLTSVTIPQSVTSIEVAAFSGCSGLTSVKVGWDMPFEIEGNAFRDSNYQNATLYVPRGTKAAYEAADVWKDFGTITEYEKSQGEVEVTDLSAIDNVIYMEPLEVTKGTEVVVPLQMKNTAQIRGFQVDVYLPEGMTAVKNNNGRIVAALNAARLPDGSAHTLTVSERPDGAIRLLCGSQYDETFTGNDGEIATLTINVGADVEAGNYPLTLGYVKLTETNINNYYLTDEVVTTMTVTENNTPPTIDVTDIKQLDNAIYIEPFEGRVGDDVNIEVRLKNVEETTSYGFELVLPEGMSIATEADGSFDEQVTLSARHKGHSAVTNKLSATTYKVAVASMNSKLLTGNDGVVVTIKAHVADNMAVGQYPVVIQNPLLVNGDATKPDMQETTTAVTIEDYVKGDVDGDTEVDLADAVIVINHYVGKPVNKFNEKAADVDGDGIVDLADAVKIINYYVGKIPSLSRKHIADELDPQ